MADVLTSEQELRVTAFLAEINRLQRSRNEQAVHRSTAIKFLTARKFDIARALALFSQHEITRKQEGLADLRPDVEPLHSELHTEKFTILSSRANGAAIAVFRAYEHHPLKTTHQITLQGIVYQLDAALENAETQKHGLVFIYDMSESKYSNFDYDLSQKILTMLKGGYPAKLKKVLIVTAPLWFKAPFKILRLFVREKLRDRVFTISIPQLPTHIPIEALPTSLGGTLVVDHVAWLARCAATNRSMTNRHDEDPPPKSPPQDLATEPEQPEEHPRLCGSPVEPSSSASSGFSDDDSLHCDVGHPALTIEKFIDHVRSKGRQGLIEEYSEIRAIQHEGSFNIARMRENQTKNRYTDVLCYDHSRVLLSQEVGADDAGADYIHANYVDGYKQRNAFISTQGPLPKTAADFWRMAWEQQCLVIVMTTKVVERGKNKCYQYWEPEAGASALHGDIQVCTRDVDAGPDFTVTTLDLINNKTEERRELCHCQFTSWPDYGNPQNAAHLLEFLALVRNSQKRLVAAMGDTWAGHPRGPPIIVHCSAGIGRTGTFCTLDICISRLEDSGTVAVRGTVEKIRSQRAFSIQMPDQYVFCHAALIEHAVNTNLVPSVDFSLMPATSKSPTNWRNDS